MAQGGGISGFAEGVGIGSGLARSGTGATLLRRGIVSSPPPPLDDETYPTGDPGTHIQGTGNTILAGMIPRFVRLSALVALELGREVGAEETGPGTGTGSGPNNSGHRPAGTRAALVPTAQWYFLLAGLLTRAALEGYLTAEWRGLAPLQVLMGFGLGGAAIPNDGDDDEGAVPRSPDDKYVEFEPDGMPDLADAVDVLFPSWKANAGAGGGTGDESGDGGEEGRGENSGRVGSGGNDGPARVGGEAEYAREMRQRLARVCKIDCPPPCRPPLLFCCPPLFFRCAYAYGFSLIGDFRLSFVIGWYWRWPCDGKPSVVSLFFFPFGDFPCRMGPDNDNASSSTSPQARGISPRIWRISRGGIPWNR